MKKSIVITIIAVLIVVVGLFWASSPAPSKVSPEVEVPVVPTEGQPPVPGIEAEPVEEPKRKAPAPPGPVTISVAFTPNFNTENPRIAPAPTNSVSKTESNSQSQ